jgi:carbonic anhydrase/acetyltransferase-like protein (isoleucine patch superfamily)
MPRYEFEGANPTIHDDAYVAHDAILVGDVTVEADASVWPGAVLRGDIAPVRIGRQTHVGDNATLHASQLDERVMVGHGSVINESEVREGALIGFNSTVTNAVIGDHSIVASGTVVPEGYEVPPRSFVRGIPASVTPLAETTIDADAVFEDYSSGGYTNLAARHRGLFR